MVPVAWAQTDTAAAATGPQTTLDPVLIIRRMAQTQLWDVPYITPRAPLSLGFVADSLGRFPVVGLGPDAALQYLPAVQVRSYGGHGGLRTVSLRGFATNQTQVLLDGVPIENPQFGSVNLGVLQLAGLSGVTAIQGAAPDAVNPGAGAVLLDQATYGRRLGLSLGLGSFGERLATLQGGLRHDNPDRLRFTAVRGAYQYQAAQDDYPFSLNGISGTREAAQFGNHHLMLSAAHSQKAKGQSNARWGIRYGAFGRVARQQVPAAVVLGNPTGLDERMNQQQGLQYICLQYQPDRLLAANWRLLRPWKPTAMWLSIKQQYDFTEFFFQASRQVYTLHLAYAELGARWRGYLGATPAPRLWYNITGRVQGQWSHLAGNNLARQEGPRLLPLEAVERREGHAAATLEVSYFYWRQPLAIPGQVTVSGRTNWVRGFEPQPNAYAALCLPLVPQGQVALTGLLSHSTRIPAFNELYFYGYGNSTLPPEVTRQAQGGLSFRYAQWFKKTPGVVGPAQPTWENLALADTPTVRLPLVAELSVQGFVGRTQNKIVALPISPVRWSTLSIGQTQTTGLEARLALALGRWLRLNGHYTLQHCTDRTVTTGNLLPYTPQEVLGGSLLATLGPVQLSFNALRNGWRYPTLANDPAYILPAYWLLDAQAVYRQPVGPLILELALSAQNLLDARYEVIRSYPMPGRSFRLEVSAYW